MCTVSFYRNNYSVIITSNRDENYHRPLAYPPKSEYVNGRKLFFPKDPQGGGTWFAVNENGDTFVLLNGAAAKHIPKPPYQKSRGIIILDLASAPDFGAEWHRIDLTNIEPFTIVVFIQNKLLQVRWNGKIKEYKSLNISIPKIWSSYTLYEPEVILKGKSIKIK